jgi:hypothetical protein
MYRCIVCESPAQVGCACANEGLKGNPSQEIPVEKKINIASGEDASVYFTPEELEFR